MKLTKKQENAIEKITGKFISSFHPEAIRAYFDFTDKGKKIIPSKEWEDDFNDLITCHRWHPITVEMWKEDFRKGLLFMSDFKGMPLNYVKHAQEICLGTFNAL